ncbi:MAG: NAD-dependent epimerase/dehydratase family protein [Actinomycetota bacterium]
MTGAAGFVGSSLVDALLERGHEVRGVDRFSEYYDTGIKRRNVTRAHESADYELSEVDLAEADVAELIEGADVVFHQSAQAGVRASWGGEFQVYERDNITSTQRLLEAVAGSDRPPRVVYASSSSVYGNADRYPTVESDLPAPHSPYGVTKLAAEHLCRLYSRNHGVHTVSLRYFTVYGPRQRPDMAFHRLCNAALGGDPFPLFGDGSAIRDFTYIDDVVEANLAAARADVAPGSVYNIAGGGQISMTEVIEYLGSLIGSDVPLLREGSQMGDVKRTGGDPSAARTELDWKAQVPVKEGLARQLEYHRGLL